MATIRRKRGDTQMGTIEEKYNVDFGVRKDMKLGNYLRREGFSSLSKLIEKNRGRK